ncbi:MAG: hypothetical protein HYX66_08070 [Ignavibacteria bacterium]|nr:hypothetical protein [Ignavibacteria bacterium]
MRPAFFLCLTLALAILLYDRVDFIGAQSSIDLQHYRLMAQAAPAFLQHEDAPFVYRPLPPWIAGIMGRLVGGDVNGFFVVSIVVVLVGAYSVVVFLKKHGVSEPTSTMLASVSILSPSVFGGSVFNPFQLTDAMGITLIILGLMALENESWPMFGLCLLLGALTRETVLLLVPLAIMKRNLMLMLACLPAIAVAVGIREWAIVHNEGWTLWGNLEIYLQKATSAKVWYRILINAFAPISLLPLAVAAVSWNTLKKHVHVFVLAAMIGASVFVGADVERLLGPAFIAVALAAGAIVDNIRHRKILILLTIVFAITPLFHPVYARFDVFTKEVSYAVSFLCTAALAIVTFFTYRSEVSSSSLSRQ